MYAAPSGDRDRDQAKLIVNMVVAVFLIIGLLLMFQYFHFLYLREIPLIGHWLMDVYERIFGVPRVLILHGDDSIGDWEALQSGLTERMIFYSEDLDARKFGAGLGNKLKEYGLVIVEDARRLDKDKLINLDDYVRGGGNLILVGDAGTVGYVEHDGNVIANQTGWTRRIVCIDEASLDQCDCDTVAENTTCRFLPGEAEQTQMDFSGILGLDFIRNEIGGNPRLEIVDTSHWTVAGINRSFNLPNVNRMAVVSNEYDSELVANMNMTGDFHPAIIVNDEPGAWGMVVYFAYPPEETMEIIMPLVERMRY